jgi:hypothetical protein
MKGFVADEHGNVILDIGGVYQSSPILLKRKAF